MSDRRPIPLKHRLPMTRIKMAGARVLYRVLKLGMQKDKQQIKRGGINYEIDLTEGIDLSLFVFGAFQDHVKDEYFKLPSDSVVFDVGANIGSMSLRFSTLVPNGKVYAFEPTTYAYQKFLKNLSLNPELAKRIVPTQAFVSDKAAEKKEVSAYSSWKIDGSSKEIHPLHGGVMQSADAIDVVTLDGFVEQHGITRLDLLKVDTDGHEIEVLRGAKKTLERFRPPIIFEAGLYLIEGKGDTFDQYLDYLKQFGYTFINTANGKPITHENYLQHIPLRATTDVVAIPARA